MRSWRPLSGSRSAWQALRSDSDGAPRRRPCGTTEKARRGDHAAPCDRKLLAKRGVGAGGCARRYEGALEPRLLVEEPGLAQWLYPGLDIVLQRAEAEGYFHNVSTGAAMVFVLWRMEEARAVPRYVTVSYDEASRWMDGGAQVDPVAQVCGL